MKSLNRLEIGTNLLMMGVKTNDDTIIAAALMVYHQFLIRHRQPSLCIDAFLNNSWLGAVIFAGIVASYIFAK